VVGEKAACWPFAFFCLNASTKLPRIADVTRPQEHAYDWAVNSGRFARILSEDGEAVLGTHTSLCGKATGGSPSHQPWSINQISSRHCITANSLQCECNMIKTTGSCASSSTLCERTDLLQQADRSPIPFLCNKEILNCDYNVSAYQRRHRQCPILSARTMCFIHLSSAFRSV
jgi:hypothetical protein